jgi:hypothetical protein
MKEIGPQLNGRNNRSNLKIGTEPKRLNLADDDDDNDDD